MTPPDQPEEQPSALSRLERALAGFGDPARNAAADEAPPAAVDEADPPAAAAQDADGESDEAASPSVLDIAAALDAVERLSAAEAAETESVDEADEAADAVDSRSAIEALDAKWAREQPPELPGLEAEQSAEEPPRFEPADLRSRIQEFEAVEEVEEPAGLGGAAIAEAGLADEVDDEFVEELVADRERDESEAEAEPLAPTRPDAAATWQRDGDDAALPYFVVEDNRPVAVAPIGATATATLEELRPAPPVEEDRHNASVARTLAEIPILLLVAALIAFLVKTFLAQAYYIPSGSMLPQLQVDDRVVVSKLAYKTHDPRRGDIIVFDDPRNGAADADDDEGLLRKIGEGIGIVQPSTDEFIKRVIGLPGETVEARDGHVFINGRRLYEPYLPDNVVTTDFPSTRVREGHLWVMGDNRAGSADSRVFGQIEIDSIVGRAVVTVWPFGNASFL